MKQVLKKMAKGIGLNILYNNLQDLFLRWRGFHLLSKEQTIAFMRTYQLKELPETRTSLPQIIDCADAERILFASTEYSCEPQYVWEYQDANSKPQISRYGSVVIRRKVLCTDRTHNSFYKEVWKSDVRPVKLAPLLIAPFSHYQSELGFTGYFDFVFSVLVKICRIKDALPGEDLSDTLLSYPPFKGHYETEYLKLLDLNPDNLIDSSEYQVVSPRILTGNSRNWFPHIEDIRSLKRQIEKKFKPVKTASNRIYISRSGRRRIVNEGELIVLLKKFDFIIIEDIQRSITEQISIYHNASFIIGPHGASFGNIIWCEPGTHLFELFSPDYIPGFFVYLSTMMGMKYSAHCEGLPDPQINYLDGINEDIYVSIPKIELCLNNIFRPSSAGTGENVA